MADAPGTLTEYGWDSGWAAAFEAVVGEAGLQAARPGRVVRHDGIAVMVTTVDGVAQHPMRGTVPPLAVGDWVAVADRAVAAQLPRRNAARRRDVDKDVEQVLAANIDLVVAVCGLDRPVRQGRIQRVGMIAADADVPFVVVLTKADLADDGDEVAGRVRAENPSADGLVCARGDGVAETGVGAIAEALAGGTTVMVGESGAGKSTLTTALLGAEVASTGAVRSTDAKGRHTTTSRELHVLPRGGVLVDSPGIRSVGVYTDEDTMSDAFEDIDELATQCRFRDCAHGAEPGCAVLGAVADGSLDPARLAAWRGLLESGSAGRQRWE
jgi:ribosome biogenesis GTPase